MVFSCGRETGAAVIEAAEVRPQEFKAGSFQNTFQKRKKGAPSSVRF